MNIVILKSNLSRCGGLEKYTSRLASSFATHGCSVTILTSGELPPPHLYNDDITINTISPKRSLSYRDMSDFDNSCITWLLNNKYDIIFGMERNSFQTHYRAGNGVHAAYLNRRKKIEPFIKKLSFAINPLHRRILKLERMTYENPSLQKLFTNSAMVRNEILEHYNVDKDKIVVIHNGVEWEEMSEDFDLWTQQQQHIKESLGLSPTAYQFLFIGNDFKRKGLNFLLEGLSTLSTHDFQLSVVGRDKHEKDYISLAKNLGIEDRVKFFGLRPDVRDFYKASDSLAIPSLYDPFSNVTVEALAMGLFVISSKSNGGHEILSPKTGTIIHDIMSTEDISKAITTALRNPKTEKSSKAIREHVRHLDFSSQLEKIVTATIQ